MRMSPTIYEDSQDRASDEVSKNAQLPSGRDLCIKVMAGVYAYTPLGLRVLKTSKQIVREEMNAIGGQELIMTNLQRRETWEATGRWSDEGGRCVVLKLACQTILSWGWHGVMKKRSWK